MPTQILSWSGTGWISAGSSTSVAPTLSNDWTEDNPPWAYSDSAVFTEDWPFGVTVVDIQTGSSDFFTNLQNTVNAAGQRVVVRLGEGVYHLNQFRLIGSSGDPTYSFGFWFPNLQGLLGQGPDKTFVQMDADSMTDAQLSKIATLTSASFGPIGMGLCRFDGSPSSPVLISGLTFRAADQQDLTSVASDVPAYVPQPAPHNGVVLYQGMSAQVSYARFQAAGRAITSAPPFECANIGSQYGSITWHNCEFDGRRSADLDAAQPRRCGVVMFNNETVSTMTDCWMHHSNVSRYAVNDQNRSTQGAYTLTRCKVEQISNTQNTDPAINGGASLGGSTNATPLGWESCNGTITLNDCFVSQDNNQSSGQVPMHLQLTSVGSRNPQGGRMYVNGGTFRNTGWPQMDGFVAFRIQAATYWALDGYAATLFVTHPNGQRLQPFTVTGTWPPSAAQIAAWGLSPHVHYLIRAA